MINERTLQKDESGIMLKMGKLASALESICLQCKVEDEEEIRHSRKKGKGTKVSRKSPNWHIFRIREHRRATRHPDNKHAVFHRGINVFALRQGKKEQSNRRVLP